MEDVTFPSVKLPDVVILPPVILLSVVFICADAVVIAKELNIITRASVAKIVMKAEGDIFVDNMIIVQHNITYKSNPFILFILTLS